MLSKNKKNTGAIDSGMCNSEQHGHGLVRVIWTHLCLGSAATNTFLFCAKECATNSSCGRLALARGGGAWKQINVTTFLRCGLGGGLVRTARFYSSIYQAGMEAVQTRWHRSDRPRFPPIVLLKLYPSAVATVCMCDYAACPSVFTCILSSSWCSFCTLLCTTVKPPFCFSSRLAGMTSASKKTSPVKL